MLEKKIGNTNLLNFYINEEENILTLLEYVNKLQIY